MKELSIEEKAKAYDEAIDKIKYVMEHGVSPTLNKKDLQDIFPELKESEDERIRKRIIHALHGDVLDMEETNKALAWLEKQGEKKNRKASYTAIAETGNGGINALVTRDIEIPFGTKDSELQEATYFIPKGYYAKVEGDKVVIKKGEQKPAWSEEDKDAINHLLAICNGAKKFIQFESCSQEDITRCQDWLTSLKERI